MSNNDIHTKEKIMNTVVDLLNDIDDPSKITIRQIAERAEVSIGLINYHFQTKETLLHQAVVSLMSGVASKLSNLDRDKFEDPEIKLKSILKELSDAAIQNSKFHKISVSYELLHGNIQTPLYYVPLLREIYKDQKDEIQLRIIALQLNSILQISFLRSSAFQLYTGIDIYNKSQRDKLIDTCVDNLIKK